MVFHRGHILAADQVGGFYSLRFEGDEPPAGGESPGTAPSPGAPARDAPCPQLAGAVRGERAAGAGVALGAATLGGVARCFGTGGAVETVAWVLVDSTALDRVVAVGQDEQHEYGEGNDDPASAYGCEQ